MSQPQRILLSGSGGLVGGAFRKHSKEQIVPLVREARPGEDGIAWNPMVGFSAQQVALLEGIDAVVHLAGEPIVGYWTADKMRRIHDSRVIGTRNLSEGLAKMTRKPSVLISASAMGYYGSRGDEALTEDSPAGTGFLVETAKQWEEATRPAAEAGIRVVNLRFGIVLAPHGGALKTMLLPFRLGLGGRLGDGRQYMSWVSLPDVTAIIRFFLENESMRGPVNVTAPEPVTNAEFTKTLAKALHRWTGPPVPKFVLRSIHREMADELFLSSMKVLPRRLLDAGYTFRHVRLQDALKDLLENQN